MEQSMLVLLLITLLKGFEQAEIILPPGPINKEVGASVLFTVRPSSLLISAIKWRFNGTDFVVYNNPSPPVVIPQYTGRVVLNTTSGTLELENLTMADSGTYTLTVTFETGIGIANNTFLQVFEPVTSLGIRGPNGSLIEYNSATFSCTGHGTIITTVWMKNNVILESRRNITFMDNNRTMVISPLMRSDTGDYQCVMSNPVSSSTALYSLLVNYGPDVRIFGLQTFEEGSDILLFCLAYSEPHARHRWIVKGEPVPFGDLYIRLNSSPSDSGDYNCTCWNNVTGITNSAVHYVTVKAVSYRMARGAEAGITLGVVIAVFIVFAVAYILIKRARKSPHPTETRLSTTSDQQTHQIYINNNVVPRISTPTPPLTTANTPGQECQTSNVYINRTPTPPPRNLPPLPRDRPI